MIRLTKGIRVYLATEPVDGRKAINGLSAVVFDAYDSSLTDGSVFVFYNRSCRQVKCLFWERNGFVLYHKRLERGKFQIKKTETGSLEITQDQLDWLLAGLDFSLMAEFPELNFEHIF
jgi:transposase